MITMILAVDINYALGYKNDLLFNFSKDLKKFKDLTMGKEVVMGRKTWESLPKKLPNRINSVLSSSNVDGADKVYSNIEDVLKQKNDICIIGGSTLYKQFIDHTYEIFITYIDSAVLNYDTDVSFMEKKLDEFIGEEYDFTYDTCRKTGKTARLSFYNYIRR